MTLRVLCPLDGSDRSFKAMERAMGLLAGAPGLEVTLFCVRQEGFDGQPADMVERFDVDEEDEIFPNESSARRMLDRAAEACARLNVPAKPKIALGPVFDEILKEAAHYDLLVMHALDRGELREKLRLSKTERLARLCGTNVMLVRD